MANNGSDSPKTPNPDVEKEKNAQEDAVADRSEYVLVTDMSGEVMELPTNPDNTVFMSTLQATVAGATGLKFKNPKTGASRAVIVDPSGSKLLPPTDGWEGKTFTVIASAATPARGADVSVKRRKMGDDDYDSDSDGDGRHGRKRLLESGPQAPVERRPVDLIVLGVNYKTTDETFKTYFEQYGTVAFAELKRTPEGSSKGFGFVQMATIEDQDKVVAVQQHMIDGRRCEVKIPDQRYDTGYGGGGGAKVRPVVSKIFVGRLIEKIDESTLREFFDKEAKELIDSSSITDVFIPRPFRGFAFVTFSHPEVAERICKLNNFVIDGTSVVVSLAVPREEMNAGPPGGPNGFFNEFGYSYGYGKGGAGYGGYPGGGYGGKPDYYGSPGGYQHPRGAYEGWVAPPAGGTPNRPANQWLAPGRNANNAAGSVGVVGGHLGAYRGNQNGPSTSAPPVQYPKMPDSLTVGNQIASGLDALNLNQKNPELLSAAWNAFITTLNGQQQQQQQMHQQGMGGPMGPPGQGSASLQNPAGPHHNQWQS